MKLKRLPEDFQVEEQTAFTPDGGQYALYRMTKRSIGTPEAIELVCRKWNIPRLRISYGGLKDRHALTRQYVTISHGPRRTFHGGGVELEFLGFASRHFQPQEISGNRFEIVIRDFSADALALAEQAVLEVARDGLPNYFDDQRFGSVGESGEFIAPPWCRGEYERAFWLSVAEAHPEDRTDDKEQKRILRELWGQWEACKAALERSNRRSLVTYLVDHPHDFKAALALVKIDLRGLYLSAFQSHVWNQMLAELIRREAVGRVFEVALKLGPAPFVTGGAEAPLLPGTLTDALLPLPSARVKDDVGDWGPLIESVLAKHGLTLREMRVKYPRDSFFSKGHRAAWVKDLQIESQSAPDELYAKRHKLTLKFNLPRGSYATILVKRICETAGVSGGIVPTEVDQEIATEEPE